MKDEKETCKLLDQTNLTVSVVKATGSGAEVEAEKMSEQ